ncbi:hypothetical protein ACFVHB_00585 [Kitasatospora sp. NPDC127111]|uniref:hypothetical protein n=1 Tax=Kitasatospora sp. NPDC127111 TaxID=3345363 RepID=UPI00362AB400
MPPPSEPQAKHQPGYWIRAARHARRITEAAAAAAASSDISEITEQAKLAIGASEEIVNEANLLKQQDFQEGRANSLINGAEPLRQLVEELSRNIQDHAIAKGVAKAGRQDLMQRMANQPLIVSLAKVVLADDPSWPSGISSKLASSSEERGEEPGDLESPEQSPSESHVEAELANPGADSTGRFHETARVEISMNLTRKDLDDLEEAARAEGASVADYIRRAIAVYRFLLNESKDGTRIVLESKRGRAREVLIRTVR